MLWFCVELPALGLEVCAHRMVDESRPAVLVENNRVVARNAVALDSGVAIGSSLGSLIRLAISHRQPVKFYFTIRRNNM